MLASPKSIQSGDYTINVHVVQTRDLPPRDFGDTMDPVVQVTIMGVSKNTQIYKQALNCVYDKELQFEFKNVDANKFKTSKITISVNDANPIGSMDALCSARLDLAAIYYNNNHEAYRKWILLKSTDKYLSKMKNIHHIAQSQCGFVLCSISILGPNDKQYIHSDDFFDNYDVSPSSLLTNKDFMGYLQEYRSKMVCIDLYQSSHVNLNEFTDVYIVATLGENKATSKKYTVTEYKDGTKASVDNEMSEIQFKEINHEEIAASNKQREIIITNPTISIPVATNIQFQIPYIQLLSDTITIELMACDEKEDITVAQLSFSARSIIDILTQGWRYFYDKTDRITMRSLAFLDIKITESKQLTQKKPSVTYKPLQLPETSMNDDTICSLLSFKLYECYLYLNDKEEYNVHDIKGTITVGKDLIYESKTHLVTKTADGIKLTFDQTINKKALKYKPGCAQRVVISICVQQDIYCYYAQFSDLLKKDTNAIEWLTLSRCGSTKYAGSILLQLNADYLATYDRDGKKRESDNKDDDGNIYINVNETELDPQKKSTKTSAMHLQLYTVNADALDALQFRPMLQVNYAGSQTNIYINDIRDYNVTQTQLRVENINMSQMPNFDICLINADNDTQFGFFRSVQSKDVFDSRAEEEEKEAKADWLKLCNMRGYKLWKDEDSMNKSLKSWYDIKEIANILIGIKLRPLSSASLPPIINIPAPHIHEFMYINIFIVRISGFDFLFGALHPYILVKCQGKSYQTNINNETNNNPNFMQFIKFPIVVPVNKEFKASLSLHVNGVLFGETDDKQYEKTFGTAIIDLHDIMTKATIDLEAQDDYKPQSQQYEETDANVFCYKGAQPVMPSYMLGREMLDDEMERQLDTSSFTDIRISPSSSIDVWGQKSKPTLRGLVFTTYDEEDDGISQTKLNIDDLVHPKDVRVRVYILRASHLLSPDRKNNSSDPYLKVNVGADGADGAADVISTRNRYRKNTLNPEFYESFEFQCMIPGDQHITIAVWHYNQYTDDTLIGRTVVDIEERWFSDQWKRKKKKPVEVRSLRNPLSAASMGRIHLWVDIMSQQHAECTPMIEIKLKAKPIEIDGVIEIKTYDMVLQKINSWRVSTEKKGAAEMKRLKIEYYKHWTQVRLKQIEERYNQWEQEIDENAHCEGVLTAISFMLSIKELTELMRYYIQEWSRHNTERDRIEYDFPSKTQVMQLIAGFIHSSKNPISSGIQIAKWLKKYAQYVANIEKEVLDICDACQKHVMEKLEEVHSNRLNIIRLESNNALKIAIESELKLLLSYDSVQLLRYAIWTSEPLNIIRNPIVDRINEEKSELYAWSVNLFQNIQQSFLSLDDLRYFYFNSDSVKSWWYSPISKMQMEFIFYILFWLLLCFVGINTSDLYQPQMYIVERVFWFFCASFVLSEASQMIIFGRRYWQNNNNYIDICMSVTFVILFALRISWLLNESAYEGVSDIVYLQTWFILLSLSTARIIFMMYIFKSMSLLIKNIIRLTYDIVNMFVFIFLFCVAFGISLFMTSSALDGFTTPATSIRSAIYGLLEGLDWTLFTEDNDEYQVSKPYSFLVQIQIFTFTVFAVLIILNLIIAIMSSTYEDVVEVAITEMQFDRSCITQDKKTEIATVPAPFQFYVYLLSHFIFSIIRILSCFNKAVESKVVYMLHVFLRTQYKQDYNPDEVKDTETNIELDVIYGIKDKLEGNHEENPVTKGATTNGDSSDSDSQNNDDNEVKEEDSKDNDDDAKVEEEDSKHNDDEAKVEEEDSEDNDYETKQEGENIELDVISGIKDKLEDNDEHEVISRIEDELENSDVWICRYCFCINNSANSVNTKHETFKRFIEETSVLPGFAFPANEINIIENVDETLCFNCLRVKLMVKHREMVECAISLSLFHLFCICFKLIILPFHIIYLLLITFICCSKRRLFMKQKMRRNCVLFVDLNASQNQQAQISHRTYLSQHMYKQDMHKPRNIVLYGTNLKFDFDELGDSKALQKRKHEMW